MLAPVPSNSMTVATAVGASQSSGPAPERMAAKVRNATAQERTVNISQVWTPYPATYAMAERLRSTWPKSAIGLAPEGVGLRRGNSRNATANATAAPAALTRKAVSQPNSRFIRPATK